jgi:hypothetical protein
MVMLHAHQLHVIPFGGVLRGQVFGMEVVGHHLGFDVEQPPEVLDALGERAERLVVLQIPDVMGTKARRPLARQNVFLSSAPQASTARRSGNGSRTGWGT